MLKKGVKNKETVEGLIAYFETMFRVIWARIVPVLGVTNARSMFEHGLAEAALRYHSLEAARIRDEGVHLAGLKEEVKAGKETVEHLEEALWAYLEVFTRVLGELSGEMISRQVVDVIQSKDGGKHFSEKLYRTGLRF